MTEGGHRKPEAAAKQEGSGRREPWKTQDKSTQEASAVKVRHPRLPVDTKHSLQQTRTERQPEGAQGQR